jgi:hypothetical protein
MEIPTIFSTYTQWSGYLTIACLIFTLVGFILKWGIRFRLVGITAFMAVLTSGIFALGLGLFNYQKIPGAVRFSVVYDNGGNQAVIVVPAQITESQVEATLLQAASDLFSFGRVGFGGDAQLTVRARTILHPEPGITKPVYLGQIKQSLGVRDDEKIQVEVFSESFAQLPQEKLS